MADVIRGRFREMEDELYRACKAGDFGAVRAALAGLPGPCADQFDAVGQVELGIPGFWVEATLEEAYRVAMCGGHDLIGEHLLDRGAPWSFSGLQGREFEFFGAADNLFRLGDEWFEAVEWDGDMSSALEAIVRTRRRVPLPGVAVDVVRVERVDDEMVQGPELGREWEFSGWRLVSTGKYPGHVWLYVGTDEYHGYYPLSVFEYLLPGVTA